MPERVSSYRSATKPLPLGELLVRHGALTPGQRDEVLGTQASTGRPFGQIAEEMFGVDLREIEDAWADQFASITEWIDPSVEALDPMVRGLVSRRQAWQFQIVPVGYDGEHLMVCTTRAALARALRFACRHIASNCYFVLARPEDLRTVLERDYQIDGMADAERAA